MLLVSGTRACYHLLKSSAASPKPRVWSDSCRHHRPEGGKTGRSRRRRKAQAQAKRGALLIPASSRPPQMGTSGPLTRSLANATITTARRGVWLRGREGECQAWRGTRNSHRGPRALRWGHGLTAALASLGRSARELLCSAPEVRRGRFRTE